MDQANCSHNQYEAYYQQRKAAGQRGIVWQFTLSTWVQWWGDDYQYRGKYSGQLVMGRKGDTGPYSPANTVKITVNQNTSDGNLNRFVTKSQYTVTVGDTVYNSVNACARARGLNRWTVMRRCMSKTHRFPDWYITQ